LLFTFLVLIVSILANVVVVMFGFRVLLFVDILDVFMGPTGSLVVLLELLLLLCCQGAGDAKRINLHVYELGIMLMLRKSDMVVVITEDLST